MSSMPTITGDRLLLNGFTQSDATDVFQLAGEKSVSDTTMTVPHPYTEKMAKDWISCHQSEFESLNSITFAIRTKQDGELVGAISLMRIQPGHQAELGYWVGKSFWGRGYCSEAARVILDYAFRELELNRVHACHMCRNPASGRVMQKAGLVHEGIRKQHVFKNSRYEDISLFGIVKRDWLKKQV